MFVQGMIHSVASLKGAPPSSQVDEMCAMLEKYRAENQKIVSQKEREVEALGERLKESEQNKVALQPCLVFTPSRHALLLPLGSHCNTAHNKCIGSLLQTFFTAQVPPLPLASPAHYLPALPLASPAPCLLQESWEGELGSLRGQVTSLEAELRAREEELKELLKAIDALQSKVPHSLGPRPSLHSQNEAFFFFVFFVSAGRVWGRD